MEVLDFSASRVEQHFAQILHIVALCTNTLCIVIVLPLACTNPVLVDLDVLERRSCSGFA